MTYFEDGDWIDEPVETSYQLEGSPRDLVVDSDKRPHFVASPLGTGKGVYMSQMDPGGSWYSTDLVDRLASAEIGLDADEVPVVALLSESGTFRPALARWDGIEWDFEIIQDCTDGCGRHTSMALDSQDNPHVAYRSRDNGEEVVYAHDDGTGWTHTVVADLFDYPESIAIDVDGDDRAHIVYRGDDPSHVMYVVVEP